MEHTRPTLTWDSGIIESRFLRSLFSKPMQVCLQSSSLSFRTAFLVSLHNHVCSHSLYFPFTDTLESHRRLLKALPWASLTSKLECNMEKQRLFLTTSTCLFDLPQYQSIQSAVTKSPRLDNLTTESDSHCSRWEIQDEETGYYILRRGQAGS